MIKHHITKLKSGMIKVLFNLPTRWPVYWVDFTGDTLALNVIFEDEPELEYETKYEISTLGVCEHTRYLAYHNQEKDQVSVILIPLALLIDKEDV